ncbi:MAG: LURP-one-related family protein [Planctomycetes bacterium]|nr:LURP-one-related family protein [Planctomycetota bacterium]
MRYVMKQKLFAFGDDFTIKDDQGRDRYFVDGKAFSIGDKLSFQDIEGNELARIEQKVLSLGKTYRIYRGGSQVATVKKQLFTFFRDVFDVEDEAAGELDATGDFIDHEYQFTRDGRPIATVSKKFFSWTDTYGVDIAEGEDDVLILACTVVIDMCSHDER